MNFSFLEYIVISLSLLLFVSVSCISCIKYSQDFIKPNHTTYISVARLESTAGPAATAWALDENLLITAGHFCEAVEGRSDEMGIDEEIVVGVADQYGASQKAGIATILSYDNNEDNYADDICVLESVGHGLVPLIPLKDMDQLRPEDVVTYTGAPKMLFPVKRSGFIVHTKSERNNLKGQIVIAIDVQAGASGSPLMWNGHVIGMVVGSTSRVHDGRHLHNGGIAVRIDDILRFVAENI